MWLGRARYSFTEPRYSFGPTWRCCGGAVWRYGWGMTRLDRITSDPAVCHGASRRFGVCASLSRACWSFCPQA